MTVFITGLFPLMIYPYSRSITPLVIHKIIFLLSNLFPGAIDNRTTLAMIESAAYLTLVARFPGNSAGLYRIILGVVIFFSGFHKLNSSHLLSVGSCTNFMAAKSIFSFLVGPLLPWAVCIGEIVLGLLLLFFSGPYVLLFFGLFTGALTLIGFQSFMSLLWVLAFPMFLRSNSRIKLLFFTGSLAASFIAWLQKDYFAGLSLLSNSLIWLILLRTQPGNQGPVNRRLAVAFGLIITINCLTPYFGWKSTGSFSMYGNLRVERNKTNHFLIQKPFLISENLIDTVTLISTQLPRLNHVTNIQPKVPLKVLKVEISRSLQLGQPFQVQFLHKGIEVTITTKADALSFIEDLSPVEEVLLAPSIMASDAYCFF